LLASVGFCGISALLVQLGHSLFANRFFSYTELKIEVKNSMRTQFETGEVYYLITYADADSLFPVVRCVAFIGKNIENDTKDRWYFQDTTSYADYGMYKNIKDDVDLVEVHRLDESGLSLVFDYEGLCRDLEKCNARRNK
jgi:hypothetical protein